MAYHDCGESRIECSENEKQHEIRIFINSIDISALYFFGRLINVIHRTLCRPPCGANDYP
ncbi:hypothetical protein DMH88_02440 [Escherichia coli]|nr:hypothetical protein [Escherichia coli]